MIDLYAAPTSNGLRAKIMLDECGLPYTLHAIDLAKGEQKTPEFLAMNPMGQIPVIVDHDGPGGAEVTLAQSVAILVYLAGKSGKFIPADAAAQPRFWEALANAATDVSGALGSVLTISRATDPHGPSRELFENRFRSVLKIWDGFLAERTYCAGDEVTIADFALYGVFARAQGAAPELVEGYPSLDRWAKAIGARPGVQKGLDFG